MVIPETGFEEEPINPTMRDDTVTLRARDSTEQVRVSIDHLVEEIGRRIGAAA